MKKTLFTGVGTALLTPFANGEIDLPALRQLVEFQVENGVDALIANGTTGEPSTMTDDEWTASMTAKNEEIRHDILTYCQTKRRDHFKYTTEICRSLANKHRISRAGEDDGRYTGGGKTYQHILNLVGDLISEGYLIEHKEPDSYTTYIRTINKTEQKQKKLYI